MLRLVIVCIGAAVSVVACDNSPALTQPDPSRQLADVLVTTYLRVNARDNTSREWKYIWGATIEGVDDQGDVPPTTTGRLLARIPSPVLVIEIMSVFIGPDGSILQTNSTSAQQLIDSRVGGNQVVPRQSISMFYDGHFRFPIPPSSDTQSRVVTSVRVVDGANQTHTVETVTAVTYETPPQGPCSPARGGFVYSTVEITRSGLQPASYSTVRGPCVIFVNSDVVAHDVRSDPHPEHLACPEFNVGMLAPGTRALTSAVQTFGTCAYHDELRPDAPEFRGRVLIAQ